jgi:HK97 family phage prohead protease
MLMHDEQGRSVFIRGLAAAHSSPSCAWAMYGGAREMILPGAFETVCKQHSPGVTLSMFHLSGGAATIASVAAGTLHFWSDARGLWFEAGPLAASPENATAAASICQNRVRECSWRAHHSPPVSKVIDGEEFRLIRQIHSLEHIALCEVGAYAATGVWCSHEDLTDLPPRLRPLVMGWTGRQSAPRPRAAAAPRAAVTARARPRTRAPAPAISDAEAFGPPPGNLSMEEWMDFGRSCVHAARWMRPHNRSRRASQ